MQTEFRAVYTNEIPAAYQIIVQRTEWLNAKGIVQWLRPIPEQIIEQRQADGQLFGYWVDQQLVAVVSLLRASVAQWDNDLFTGSYLFVATLASDVTHIGHGYGAKCLKASETYAQKNRYEMLYLDCLDNAGVLPAFYATHEFQKIAEKQLEQAGKKISLFLMAKKLGLYDRPDA